MSGLDNLIAFIDNGGTRAHTAEQTRTVWSEILAVEAA